ncbi:MAG: histidine phosphatase family protein [Alphaproteobacteria bacterium]|nr:histidine phosphatase family protein [Alphaproteobacteria bacterium]
MTTLVLVRHGPTEWNEIGRVQGREDIPLSEAGRAEVRGWRLPDAFRHYRWITSPLVRAVETARLLGAIDPPSDHRLAEMDWGAWSGMHLDALRAELGDLMKAWEARGLDFQAPGGESPRDVQSRLKPFLAERAALGQATVAVAHKGIIRAVYAESVGWDMTGPAPHKLKDGCAQAFTLASDGTPRIARLNIALAGAES